MLNHILLTLKVLNGSGLDLIKPFYDKKFGNTILYQKNKNFIGFF